MKDQKNKIILNSFKESFGLIKKHKTIFLVLFLLQLVFFSLIFTVNLNYQPKIINSVNTVLDYLSRQSVEENKDILLEDPLIIHRNYENIIYNLKLAFVWCLLIFVFINGKIFYLINKLAYDKNPGIKHDKKTIKEFFGYLSKFAAINLICFWLIALFSYSNLKMSAISMVYGAFNSATIASFFIVLTLSYFMYLSFTLIYKTKFKNIFKKLFNVGIKKAHIILLTYLINFIIFTIFFLLTVFLIEKNIILWSMGIILFVLSFIWSKIFLVTVVKKLA